MQIQTRQPANTPNDRYKLYNSLDPSYGPLTGQFDRLFMTMAEELKLPLQHIARQAELQLMSVLPEQSGSPILSGLSKLSEADEDTLYVQESVVDRRACLRSIQSSADMVLQLLDSYLLSLRLYARPKVDLEPVSLSAVLYDTATELRHIAKTYGVTLRLHIQGRYEPVLANRQALQSALVALGYAMIEALPAAGAVGTQQYQLQLAAHRTKHGIVAGVYGELDALTPRAYRRACELQGREGSEKRQGYVRQPLVGVLPGSGAGVFIAGTILAAMESRLRVGRYMKLPGFAVTLPATRQLQLV